MNLRITDRLRRRRKGVVFVWVAITIFFLIAFVGLVMDTSYVMLVGHQLQNAADAAALAAASDLATSTATATTTAVSVAARNTAANASVQIDSTNDVVFGNYKSPTFTVGGSPTNAVQVTARRTTGSPGGALNLIFGPIIGITTSNVSRQAVAANDPLYAGLIVLSPTASPAIDLTGSGNGTKITVNNGGIVVDSNIAGASNKTGAVQWNGNPNIIAASMTIVGNDPGVSSIMTGTLHVNSQPLADPLASVNPPLRTDPGVHYTSTGLSGTLAAGIYYVDGDITTSFDASAGCMIYLHNGTINFPSNGNWAITINPPASGPYAGISFFQDGLNVSPLNLGGNVNIVNPNGTAYFPAVDISLTGTPGTIGSQLICKTLSLTGTAKVNINYNGNFPIIRHEAYLVK
jgi:Flp pilus assembly protein TadG